MTNDIYIDEVSKKQRVSKMTTTYNQPNVSLSYANGGMDRFGRVVDHHWKNNSNATIARIQHGYDYAGNRTYRKDSVLSNADELYAYDEINQVTGMDRGTLNNTPTSLSAKTFAENFVFDKTGNWTAFKQDTDGNASWDLNQGRTHNAANELTQIDNSVSLVAEDTNGNMTKVPKPEIWSSNYNLIYDAWNRLVQVKDSDNTTVMASYQYNGMNHRVKKTIGSTVTTHYFNENWQELVSYTGSSANPDVQYIWGTRYIDDLLFRDRDTDANGSLDERLYSIADPNWNVVALADSTTTVQERLNYNAFGKASFYTGSGTTQTASNYDWNRTFTGQVLDSESGIMFYRNRYYHTGLGRFVSRDPIVYEGKDINIYRYSFNNPNNLKDTYGMSVGSVTIVTTALAAALSACAKLPHDAAHDRYPDSGDKYKHCWVSCRISKTCGNIVAQISGLGKETSDSVKRIIGKQDDGAGDWLDSVLDMKANQSCIGWEGYVFGLAGSWIGAAFRKSCEECCCESVGYK